jgi:hypothetical protein
VIATSCECVLAGLAAVGVGMGMGLDDGDGNLATTVAATGRVGWDGGEWRRWLGGGG